MFLDKPLTGFGPGTYQFQYLDYQLKEEMTPISVTSPYNIRPGHGGTAHQEYLLVLSEMGIFGFLFFTSLIILTWKRGCNLITSQVNTEEKVMIAAMCFAMLTYVVHAFFNNFLDTDKTAFLFLGSMAFINQVYTSKKKFLCRYGS
jgi:O-antigen ligase